MRMGTFDAKRPGAGSRKIIVVSLLLILVLCSCDTLDLLREQPDVEVVFKDLTPLGLSNNGLDFLARLDVTNKGSATIPRTKIDWDLFLNDYSSPFANDSLDEGTRIEGGERKTLEVPVRVSTQKLLEQGPSIVARYLTGQRDVRYTLKMKISFLNISIMERSASGTTTLPSGIF